MSNYLFADFPFTTAEEWLAQITKDLKGKAPDEMYWSPDGELRINPYVHADDVPESMAALPSFGTWKIGESFTVTDAVQSNHVILDALLGGVESLQITCTDTMRWEDLLAGVELPLMHLGVQIDGDIEKGIRGLLEFAGKKYEADALHMTTYFSNRDTPVPLFPGLPDLRYCATPTMTKPIADRLAVVIRDALDFSEGNTDRLIMHDLAISVDMDYLVEIARLRALRILWTNVAEALEFTISPAFAIEAHTTAPTSDDPHDHMIRSTVMAVAAVLGGADRVYIHPAAGKGHSASFYRHIARNLHHILRFESKFTEIPDPIAGAYYIDRLTKDLVDKSWEILLQKIKKTAGSH